MQRICVLLAAAALWAGPALGGWNETEDDQRYQVVINHEEQYSLWFADREVPEGWKPVEFEGSKSECLDYIEEVWTDMRPLSWRKERGWGDWESTRHRGRYQVVINHEEQYSVWFADRELPEGWKPVRFRGTRAECLDHIEEVWTDMRPLSWRRHWKDR